MEFKTIQIDCKGLTEKDLHLVFKEKLGFPDFYGMNWDALIDCLSSLRDPETGMTEVSLEEDEVLLIYCNDLSKSKFDSNVFIDVIEFVNARGLAWFNKPFVVLCPIESDILSIMKARIEAQQLK
jgi:RNAse (barnase) inhibitor barstar